MFVAMAAGCAMVMENLETDCAKGGIVNDRKTKSKLQQAKSGQVYNRNLRPGSTEKCAHDVAEGTSIGTNCRDYGSWRLDTLLDDGA